jgi:hypothetical protein
MLLMMLILISGCVTKIKSIHDTCYAVPPIPILSNKEIDNMSPNFKRWLYKVMMQRKAICQ